MKFFTTFIFASAAKSALIEGWYSNFDLPDLYRKNMLLRKEINTIKSAMAIRISVAIES